ncbi:MAG: DUF2807 domain-containing protein [Bacteroidetes bacterium]|nr:DUF2807 domain-containing protein [Bacteroidota bacterium]
MKQSRLFSYLFCFLTLSFVNSLAAQKAISVESFSEIVLTGRLNVELKIADKEEVILETKGIEVEDIGVNVKGGVLKINALNAFKNKNIEINIIIYHKDLYEISASAGSIVTKEETLNGDKLDLDVSSGAKISIDVNVKSLKAFCSSGANLMLSGKVESGQLTAATGGMIDGKKLEAERAYVVSSTGANILVKAISELDIRSNTGGNVTYYGTPVKKTIKKVMAGEVVNEY